MNTIAVSYWWVLILFLIFTGITVFIAFIFSIGKKYLLVKLKANLWFFKYKGAWVTYTKRDGRYYLFYILVGKNKKVRLFGDKQYIGNSDNTLVDIVNEMIIGADGKLIPTANFYQGEPVYHLVEGSPTNIIIQSRDYEQDIAKLKEIIKTIDNVDPTDEESNLKIKNKLYQLFFTLYSKEFKYLPSAKEIVKNILLTEKRLNDEKEKDATITSLDIIREYKIQIIELIKLLTIKDKTLVNYDELFCDGRLNDVFNQSNQLSYIAGILKSLNFKNLDKVMYILIVIAIIGFVAVGYMVDGLTKKVDVMQSSISNLSNQINEDMNFLKTNVSSFPKIEELPNFPQNPIGVNNG